MIEKDAIEILKSIQDGLEETRFLERCALDMAIEALKEQRPHGEWIDQCQKALAELEQATVWDSHTIKATHILRGDEDV